MYTRTSETHKLYRGIIYYCLFDLTTGPGPDVGAEKKKGHVLVTGSQCPVHGTRQTFIL